MQDEWKPFEHLTINFGGRLDFENAFVNENQLSPRLNVVYEPFKGTTLHAGYARYFTPPPLESVPQSTLEKFAGTTNAPAIMKDSPVTAERAHYFDAGITQQILPGWNVGVDGFYKSSHSLIDEGQFGAALVLSSFNYERGRDYGGELTTSYDHGPFSAYGNLAWEWARGTSWSSAQFLFDPAEFQFVKHHWVFLDHDQRLTASTGVSYTWMDWKASADFLYGSGLRQGFANTKSVPAYGTVNVSLQRQIKITAKTSIKIRFDVVNLLDDVYRTSRRQRHRRFRTPIWSAARLLRHCGLRFLMLFSVTRSATSKVLAKQTDGKQDRARCRPGRFVFDRAGLPTPPSSFSLRQLC